jgi:hypothetical protein
MIEHEKFISNLMEGIYREPNPEIQCMEQDA